MVLWSIKSGKSPRRGMACDQGNYAQRRVSVTTNVLRTLVGSCQRGIKNGSTVEPKALAAQCIRDHSQHARHNQHGTPRNPYRHRVRRLTACVAPETTVTWLGVTRLRDSPGEVVRCVCGATSLSESGRQIVWNAWEDGVVGSAHRGMNMTWGIPRSFDTNSTAG